MCWTLAGLRSLLAIRATLDVSREIEAEYLKTKELINKMGEQHQQELEDHGAEIISRMSSTFGVRNLLKTLDKTRVCLHDLTPQQKCLLTFARETPGWRLVGMPAADLTIEVGAEPKTKG